MTEIHPAYVAALVALQRFPGLRTDQLEVIVTGDGRGTVPPGALKAAVEAAVAAATNHVADAGRMVGEHSATDAAVRKVVQGVWEAAHDRGRFGHANQSSDRRDIVNDAVLQVVTLCDLGRPDDPSRAAMLAVCKELMPSGICTTNRNVSDAQVIPMDVTMGELRRLAAAIALAASGVGA